MINNNYKLFEVVHRRLSTPSTSRAVGLKVIQYKVIVEFSIRIHISIVYRNLVLTSKGKDRLEDLGAYMT